MYYCLIHVILMSIFVHSYYRYGAILERFQMQDPSLITRIKGCIVDSAPVAAPDPQVMIDSCSFIRYVVMT